MCGSQDRTKLDRGKELLTKKKEIDIARKVRFSVTQVLG